MSMQKQTVYWIEQVLVTAAARRPTRLRSLGSKEKERSKTKKKEVQMRTISKNETDIEKMDESKRRMY